MLSTKLVGESALYAGTDVSELSKHVTTLPNAAIIGLEPDL